MLTYGWAKKFSSFYSIYIVIPGSLAGVFYFRNEKLPKKKLDKNRVKRAGNPATYLSE